MTLGGIGVWSPELRYRDDAEVADAVAELEGLGYSAVWIGDTGGDLLGALDRLLRDSTRMSVASGILNLWMQDAGTVSAWWAALPDEQRDRLLLGVGVSHAPLVGGSWRSPLAATAEYLDRLDVPSSSTCLAALRPKMVDLAARRTAGVHTYLMLPEHTARVRAQLGAGPLLAPEQGIVLERDPERARAIARRSLKIYARLPNYAGLWIDEGFTAEDVEGLSDRLVDALVAWGDVDDVAARVRAHREAGADHVCIQVLVEKGAPMAREAWRELAPALLADIR